LDCRNKDQKKEANSGRNRPIRHRRDFRPMSLCSRKRTNCCGVTNGHTWERERFHRNPTTEIGCQNKSGRKKSEKDEKDGTNNKTSSINLTWKRKLFGRKTIVRHVIVSKSSGKVEDDQKKWEESGREADHFRFKFGKWRSFWACRDMGAITLPKNMSRF
jgi:hypothetical protein